MSDVRAASRYAKSLLELADEKGVLDEVQKDMLLLSSVCEENRDFLMMLKNPIVKHRKKREILEAIFKGKVNEITCAIFDIITRKNREPILPTIATEFNKQYNVINGIVTAKITTTTPLDSKLKKEFEEIVLQISKGNSVQLEEVVDENIIGGFVLNVEDKQIDDSIKTKLNELKIKFSQNSYIKEF
ncbi:MAG: ATP synthase F1 subunit delta [Cyclobacteriaceae bacterium]|nr:ATP synthase F1 subunit delta [Cyclobacteriaceae bacterium]